MGVLSQVYPLVSILEISTGEVNCMSMYGSGSLSSVHHVEVPELYTFSATSPTVVFDACTKSSGANVRLFERTTSPLPQPAGIYYIHQ